VILVLRGQNRVDSLLMVILFCLFCTALGMYQYQYSIEVLLLIGIDRYWYMGEGGCWSLTSNAILWKTDHGFGFLVPENLWSNFIRNRYFLKIMYPRWKNQIRKFWETNYKFLIFSSRVRYFEKITAFYKVWSKIFRIEESESVIDFSKYWVWGKESPHPSPHILIPINTNWYWYWYYYIPIQHIWKVFG
jgi:hypothetical protein